MSVFSAATDGWVRMIFAVLAIFNIHHQLICWRNKLPSPFRDLVLKELRVYVITLPNRLAPDYSDGPSVPVCLHRL
jgi:hypothetical protein